jgi:hypothetical protein
MVSHVLQAKIVCVIRSFNFMGAGRVRLQALRDNQMRQPRG